MQVFQLEMQGVVAVFCSIEFEGLHIHTIDAEDSQVFAVFCEIDHGRVLIEGEFAQIVAFVEAEECLVEHQSRRIGFGCRDFKIPMSFIERRRFVTESDDIARPLGLHNNS